MKISLFGAGGFIGSNLARHLQENPKYDVRLFDVHDEKLRLRFENTNFHFEHLDISENTSKVDAIGR